MKERQDMLNKAIAEEEEKAKHPTVGSIEWAIEMMKQEMSVSRPEWPTSEHYRMNDYGHIILVNEENKCAIKYYGSQTIWLNAMKQSMLLDGWQIFQSRIGKEHPITCCGFTNQEYVQVYGVKNSII